MRLKGKTALVTGRGPGASASASPKPLVREGARVAVLTSMATAKAKEAAKAIGRRALP